jgi:hypothetical protein
MIRRPIAQHVAAFMVVSVITASPALAFDEPDGFRGVPWGATEEQLRSSVSLERACVDYDATSRPLGDRLCTARLQIADVKVRAAYSFRANQLTRVSLHFAPKDFDRLAAIFVERYGPATVKERDRLNWVGEKTFVSLYRYFNTDLSKGYASITTRAEIEESKRLRDEQTKGAAKGL